MKNKAQILQKVFVNYFFRLNAGFFAFFFFVLFGVVKGGQLIDYHLSLIQAFLGSKILLGIVIFVWALYTLKCTNYIIGRLLEPRQLFLSTLNQLSTNSIRCWMLFIHAQVYAPIWIYACIAMGVAIHFEQYLIAAIILFSNITLMALAVEWYTYTLRNRFVKPLFSFPIWHLWQERKQMLLLTKLFTLLFLYGFIQMYEPYHPDLRPMLLCFLLIVVAHTTIINQIHAFENEWLLFSRNLPIGLPTRFLQIILLYLVLFLPELVYVWKAFPIHFAIIEYPLLVLMVIALPAFFHCIQYTGEMKQEEYMNIVFVVMAVLFFMILYSLTIWLLLLTLLMAYVFFHVHYFGFEKSNNNQGKKS
jgi:hypothetical protein